jgi:hypothetical protein
MYPHHTGGGGGGGDHPSIHQEEELAKFGYRTDRKVEKI